MCSRTLLRKAYEKEMDDIQKGDYFVTRGSGYGLDFRFGKRRNTNWYKSIQLAPRTDDASCDRHATTNRQLHPVLSNFGTHNYTSRLH